MQRRDVLKGVVGATMASAWTAPVAQAASLPTTATQPGRSADLILTNGRILTVDRNFTIADSIAIGGDRILAVGPRAAMAAFTARGTRTIDLRGKTVVPGLIDTHAHMAREGLKGVFPSLAGARSIRDIQDRIADLARGRRPGEWIVTMPIGDPPSYPDLPGSLAEKRWPTRQEIDAAAPNNPVFIRPIWGYWRGPPLVGIANTEALRRAGITRDTVSPLPELLIERDAHGDPTGIFVEDGLQPTAELIWFREATRFSHADRVRGIPIATAAYHAFGTTGIFEGHGVAAEEIRAYKEVHRDGKLTMRAGLVVSPDWRALGDAPLGPLMETWAGTAFGARGLGDDRLRVAGLYVNIGESAGARVRGMAAPDTGWAGYNYDTGQPRARVREILLSCAKNDIRAVMNRHPQLLDLLEEVDRQIPLKGRRWVITHIEFIPPRDIERIVRMGLVLTSHTNDKLYQNGPALQAGAPPELRGWNTPLRALLEAGVSVGLITDNAPISLWRSIGQSVTRRARNGELIAPEQAITRQQALRCATMHGASVCIEEAKRGSLEAGKLADLAVLSADPLTVPEAAIRDITAELTMVGGKIVHQAERGSA